MVLLWTRGLRTKRAILQGPKSRQSGEREIGQRNLLLETSAAGAVYEASEKATTSELRVLTKFPCLLPLLHNKVARYAVKMTD